MEKQWNSVSHVLNSNYLSHELLADYYGTILVTYETRTGLKHVKAVHCNRGKLSSKEIKDKVTAFMFMPEPYKETT